MYAGLPNSNRCGVIQTPEGPYIQLLGNWAPKYHTIEGIMGPNSLVVVCRASGNFAHRTTSKEETSAPQPE